MSIKEKQMRAHAKAMEKEVGHVLADYFTRMTVVDSSDHGKEKFAKFTKLTDKFAKIAIGAVLSYIR